MDIDISKEQMVFLQWALRFALDNPKFQEQVGTYGVEVLQPLVSILDIWSSKR